MVQADICKYIILSDTDRKKGDLQYPHPNVVHRSVRSPCKQFWPASGKSVDLTRPLIRAKENEFFLLNRPTQRESKLVLLQVRALLVSFVQKKLVGV